MRNPEPEPVSQDVSLATPETAPGSYAVSSSLPTKVSFGLGKMRLMLLGLLLVGFIAGIAGISLAYGKALKPKAANLSGVNGNYTVASIPLGDLAKAGNLTVDAAGSLSVNGQLRVNGGIVLDPATRPATAVSAAGQMYYDRDDNLLRYFNGQVYVDVLGGPDKTTLNGQAGNITLGSGLTFNGNQLSSVPGVTSLQGQTGAVTLTSGGGISIAGSTITNTGVTMLGGQTGNVGVGAGLSAAGGTLMNTGVLSIVSGSGPLVVTHDASGNYTILDIEAGIGGNVALGPVASQDDSGTNPSIWINKTGSGNLLQLSTGAVPVNRFVIDPSGAIISGTIGFNQVTAKPNFINSIDTATGDVLLGVGLSRSGQTVSNSGALSVGGLSGAITLGSGLTVSAGQLVATGSGVGSVTGTPNQIIVTGSGALTLSLPQDIATTSTPTFANINLSAPLGVTNGGTGAVSFTTNGVIVGNGAGTLTSVAAGGAGMCLVSSVGAPVFQACPGSGGVVSVNAGTGAVTIGGASAGSVSTAGNAITLNDATAAVKGLASFSGTNFSVVGGVVNTIQGIGTTATPTFGGLNLTTALSIANGGTGASSAGAARTNLEVAASGANADITSLTGVTSVGTTATALSIQGSDTTTLSATAAGQTTIIGFATPGANVTYLFQTAAAGTYGICTTAGNCSGVGGGVTTPGGTSGKIAKFSGGQTLVDSLLSESGAIVTVNGTLATNTLTRVGGVSNITVPNAAGTLAVSVSGPLSLDAAGNISCASCLTSGGGGSGGVTSVNGMNSAILVAGTANQIIVTDSAGTVTLSLPQNIATTSSPTFAGLSLASALGVVSGGTGLTALPSNGQLLIGNGAGYTLGNIIAGTGISITNAAGSITTAVDATVCRNTNNCGYTVGGSSVDLQASTPGTAQAGNINVTGAIIAGGVLSAGSVTAGTVNNLTLASNATGFSITGGTIPNTLTLTGDSTINQSLATTSSPTFNALTLSTALPVTSGGTGAITMAGARTNLGAAAAGANSDITSLTGLTTALTVAQGGTGTASLTQNGVLIGQGTSGLTSLVAGAAGQCLVSTAGAPVFQVCPGTGGVTSVNAGTGAIVLAGTAVGSVSTVGNNITINDATSAIKGLASFSSTNFTVTAGAVDTIQGISPTSSPTFNALALTNALAVANGGTGLNSVPTNGQILIGNGTNYSLNTLTAGAGMNISNTAGTITLSSPNSGTCLNCADQTLNNLAGVAINTSLLPGANGTVDLGSGSFAFRNGYLTGTLQASTSLLTPLVDTASAVPLNVGTSNATTINLNQNTVIAAGKSLAVTGGNTASRPGSPTEGMVYYDTTTKSLVIYANGKWQADRSAATKIVADASTSVNPDGADFVVPAASTSAQTTINAAIATLPVAGGTIYLREGTYIVDGTINLTSNITFAGSGKSTVIKLKDATNVGISLLTASTKNNIKIQNLELDGNTTNQTAGLQNGLSLTSVGSGTGTTAITGFAISGITAANFRSDGAIITTSTNSNLTNSTFRNNGSSGSYRGVYLSGSYITISGNLFQGNTGYGVYSNGSELTFTGNTFQGNPTGLQSVGDNVTMTGNTFQGSTNYGVMLSSATNSSISNNVIEANGVGIYLSTVSYVSISNNIITGGGKGIDISSSSHIAVSGNTISSNTGRGISPTSLNYLDITANTISSNGGQGIYALANNHAVVSSNEIYGNAFQAVQFGLGSYNSIRGNKMHDNAGAGASDTIYADNGELNLTISDNSITDTAGTGFAIRLSPTAGGPRNAYLSNNTYSGTGAASISDSGINTTYANQVDANGNLINRGSGVFAVNTKTATTSLTLQGGFSSSQLPTPATPVITKTGAAGAATWGYKVTAYDGLGETLPSTEGTIATGVSPLTGANFTTITWVQIPGAISYKIYRTTSGGTPTTTGLIGTVVGGTTVSFNDTGIAAGAAAPAANTTGGASLAALLQGTTATFSATGSLTVGTASSATGQITFKNAGNTGAITLQAAATAGNFTVTLPAETGTICTTAASGACSALGFYIQNSTTLQASSNFHISNAGVADVSLSTPLLTTASGDLSIDPFGNTIIKGSVATSASAALNIQNSSASSILFARNDGNVGIGTTTPNAKLTVIGGTYVTPVLNVIGAAGANCNADLCNADDGTSAYITSGAGGNSQATDFDGGNGGSGGNIALTAGNQGGGSGDIGSDGFGGNIVLTAGSGQDYGWGGGPGSIVLQGIVNSYGTLNLAQIAKPASAPTFNAFVAAGALTGSYYYVISYITASGETGYSPVSAVISPSAQSVTLNIPVSPSALVVKRNLYRGTSSAGPFNYIGTSNNVSTTYTDGNPSPGVAASIDNKTATLKVEGVTAFNATGTNTWVGRLAGSSNTSGSSNTAIGYNAGSGITSGAQNVLLGYNAGTNLTTGSNNVLIGQGVTAPLATGSNQLQIGAGLSGDLSTGTLAVKTTTNSATAFTVQNAAGTALLTVDSSSSKVVVAALDVSGLATLNGGLVVATSTITQDRILVTAAAAGAARFDGTITNADLTAARTYTLPNESGTICTNAVGGVCGALGSYVQNTTSVQASSNFHISNAGVADVSLSTPLLTTASGDLNIDPVGNTIIKGSVATSASAALNIQNSSASSILFARNDGNVGIGTTTPSAVLSVIGTDFPWADDSTNGLNAKPVLTVIGGAGGAGYNTGGNGAGISLTAGAGGWISTRGGGYLGDWAGNGGNIILTAGAAGDGGGSSDGVAGNIYLSGGNDPFGSPSGAVVLQQSGGPVSAGGTLTVAGLITGTLGVNVPTGQAYKINGVSIDTAGTLTNVAYLNQANTLTGATLFKKAADSTTAFQIQNSASSPLLVADTTNMKITVQNLVVSANLTVNGHIISGGSVPTIAAGAAACTTPTVSISGTDTSGLITVTTGTACAVNGKLATITFAAAFGAAPKVTLTPAEANSATLQSYIDSATIATTTFDLDTGSTPVSSTTHKWFYHVIQ